MFCCTDINEQIEVKDPIVERDIHDTAQGIFRSLVTNNIIRAASQPDLLAVIMFAIFFGYTLIHIKRPEGHVSPVLVLFRDLNDVFMEMIKTVVGLTPFAVFSLIAGALGESDNIVDLFSNIGVLVLVVVIGLLCHGLVFLPLVFYAITKQNPYTWIRNMAPAIFFAFSSASSAATLPLSIKVGLWCLTRGCLCRASCVALPYEAACIDYIFHLCL